VSLKIIGKNVHLNVAELEWLHHMQAMFGVTEHQALEEIIAYKREQAFGYEKMGNFELARHLLMEIDEWDDQREQEYKQKVSKDIKIFLPGGSDNNII
jgi:hypothetical protein